MCFLAYFCEAQITKALRRNGVLLENIATQENVIAKRPLTVSEAMEELAQVQAVPVQLKGKVVWVRNDIKGNAANLLKAIGVPIPPKLLNYSSVTKDKKAKSS